MSNSVTNACRPVRLPSTQKCVLMALADRADDDGVAWPSIAWICEWTCFARSTVIEALTALEHAAVVMIEKVSGRNSRCQINLARLPEFAAPTRPPAGPPPVREADESEGAVHVPTRPPAVQTGPGAGPVREADPSGSRTPTRPPAGPPPVRQPDQGGPPPGPDTPIDTSKTKKKKEAAPFDPLQVELPKWLPIEAWAMWVRYRLESNKRLTSDAVRLQLRSLAKHREAGEDPVLIIETAVANTWQGLFPAKDGSTKAKVGATAGVPAWCTQAGFECVAEAHNRRCWEHNAHEFRGGKRIPAEVGA